MTQSWTLIIAPLGAMIATLLGVVVGGNVSNRSQQRHWLRDRQMEACAQILRESSNVTIELSMMHGHCSPPGTAPAALDWRPWNEALAMVNLIGAKEIVEAAHTIDTVIWRIHIQVKAGLATGAEWFPMRDRIEAQRREFVNVVRRHLAAHEPLASLGGRPASDDPIWDSHWRRAVVPDEKAGQQQAVTSRPEPNSEGGNGFKEP
ncbi:hypothetical protein [Nonomuraea lactucae]|uniref:hypothetical protein n=1 Tax=Nonomuraea lactucae TaxID=2249762 RepID=UPI0013B443DF|nr:hypothetical protein [Nonomuraea lactucae]